ACPPCGAAQAEVVVMFALVAWVLTLNAQVQTGTIVGKVTDQSGGVIPGATITAIVGERQQMAVTNAAGQYQISGLAPANYKGGARVPGFIVETIESLAVAAARQATWNVTLRVVRQPDPFVELRREIERLT